VSWISFYVFLQVIRIEASVKIQMGIPTCFNYCFIFDLKVAFEQLAQGGWTALILAARWGHTDCVQLLLDAGADKNAADNVRGRSFLGCCRVYIHVLQPALH
jgi:hypothetical protein